MIRHKHILMNWFTLNSVGAFIAFNATVTGDVTLGGECSVWFTSVIRGDVAPVVILAGA